MLVRQRSTKTLENPKPALSTSRILQPAQSLSEVKFAWFEVLARMTVKVSYFEMCRRVVWYNFADCGCLQGKK